MSEAEHYVLDSFALLSFLEDEASAVRVGELLKACQEAEARSWLSIVNFGEVIYITEREQGLHAAQRVISIVDQLPIYIVEADRSRTFAAARIKAHYPLSYADAFVVALAQETQGKIVTGDPEFEQTAHLAPVYWLRR